MRDEKVTQANQLEEWLMGRIEDGAVGEFTSLEYAEAKGLEPDVASSHIRAYLVSQRGAKAQTLYALNRKPGTRTSKSVWEACSEAKDMKQLTKTVKSDMYIKIQSLMLDGARMQKLAPGATKTFEKKIELPIRLLLATLEEIDV